MNQRDLSEKLDELAMTLRTCCGNDEIIQDVADELRKLSKENYAPGNSVSWSDLKPKTVNKKFTDPKTGRKLPF
jgi:hypothetical protein